MLGSRRGRGQSCREEWWREVLIRDLMMGMGRLELSYPV